MPSLSSTSPSKLAWLRRPAAWVALGLGGVLLLVAALMWWGVAIDAGAYRAPLAQVLSSRLGRTVQLQGAVQLRLGLRPELTVRELRLAPPAGFGGSDFLRVGEFNIQLDLWPLLHGQFRAERLAASDVQIFLRQHEDGRNNWSFGPAAATADEVEPKPNTGIDLNGLERMDLRALSLERITLQYQAGDGKPMQMRLDSLQAAVPANGKLYLKASGSVENKLPYAIEIDGGPWRDLVAGQDDWPLAMRFDFAEGRLSVQGKLDQKASDWRFGLGAPDLARFGKLLGAELPNVGAAGLSGAVRVQAGQVLLSDLSGILGKSVMNGALSYDARQARPKLQGNLTLATLDLRPFLGQDSEADPPTDWAELYRSLAGAKLNLAPLRDIDADVRLTVQTWLSLPGQIRDASLGVQLNAGQLKVPLSAVVEGVKMQGRLSADAANAVPDLKLDFEAANAEVGGLAKLLTGLPGVQGRLGTVHLGLAARGQDGAALMRSLSIHTDITNSSLSYGNDSGKPVAFRIANFNMKVAGEQALSGRLRGSLLGKPIEADLTGESLSSALAKGRSPVDLTLRSGQVVARFSGVLDGARQSADFSFSLGASRAGDVAAWLGLRPDSNLPIALAGQLRGTPKRWSLSQLVLQLGDTSAYSEIEQVQTQQQSHLDLRLEIASVNMQQLDGLLPSSPKARPSNKPTPVSLDIPILPTKLRLNDADVRVRARDIQGSALSLGEIGFDGRVREGYMQSSPFFANVAGTRYEGAVMLDLRDEQPRVQLWLSAAGVNIGRVLQELKLAKHIEASVDRLALYLDTHSPQLSGLLANAQLLAEVGGGKLALRDPNTGSLVQATLTQGSLTVAPGERLALQLDASMNQIPVQMRVLSAPLKELAKPYARVPFDLRLSSVQTELQLAGSVDRNIEARDIELALQVRGSKLNTLDPLLRVALPPWGPWSVAGRLKMSNQGYAIDGMRWVLGASELKGQASLNTVSGKGQLDLQLQAPTIQLDDFPLENWSATSTPQSQPQSKSELTADALQKKAADTSDQVQGLLTPEALQQVDAKVAVQVDQVLSGTDKLGKGSLQARLLNGRADIGPVLLEMPGGEARLSLAYEPNDRDVQAELKIAIDKFDYGVLARRFKPGSDLEGRFSLHMDVNSRAPRISQMLAHGDGRIEFAVWPKNLRSGVFDLWAVNLLAALLPTMDPKNESTVNCAIGRFSLKQGKLTQKQWVIDTSRMRVQGVTAINFADQSIHMRLQPQAKSAQFLSLATPIEVKGYFNDYRIGPNPGDVIETAIRLATSIIWVPIQRLFSEKVPADGRDVCAIELRD